MNPQLQNDSSRRFTCESIRRDPIVRPGADYARAVDSLGVGITEERRVAQAPASRLRAGAAEYAL